MKKLNSEKEIVKHIIENRGDCSFIKCKFSSTNPKDKINGVACPLVSDECIMDVDGARIRLAKEKLEEIKKLDFLEKLK